jgi:hypothetical protein
MSNQNNIDHLHEEGVLNKADMSEEHVKAINSLSKEEIEQVKAIHKSANKDNDQPVGIFF